MRARRQLEGLQLASALRESLGREGYNGSKFRGDLLAGLTVGISAIPLVLWRWPSP